MPDSDNNKPNFLTPNDPFRLQQKPVQTVRTIPMPKIKPKKKKAPEVAKETSSPDTNSENNIEILSAKEENSSTQASPSSSSYSSTTSSSQASSYSPTSTSSHASSSVYTSDTSARFTTSTSKSSTDKYNTSNIFNSSTRSSSTLSSASSSLSNDRFTPRSSSSSTSSFTQNTSSALTHTSPSALSPTSSSYRSSTTSTSPSFAETTSPPTFFARQDTTSKKEITVSDAEFILLRDFIYTTSGIYIADNRKYLIENRLSTRVRELGLKSFSEYHNYLKTQDSSKNELNKLYEHITTNETFFFRNVPQLDSVREVVFKKILENNKKTKKIRIWSAGCSSGEEPYTLAIMFAELLGPELSKWDIRITANDISTAILKVAAQAEYSDYTLRSTPPEYLPKYFDKHGPVYKIKPFIKNLVRFGQINLNDKNQTKQIEKSDVVFCRNVIIYFDDDVKRNVISAFSDNLIDNGFLIVGHSEALHNITKDFKATNHPGTIIYIKK